MFQELFCLRAPGVLSFAPGSKCRLESPPGPRFGNSADLRGLMRTTTRLFGPFLFSLLCIPAVFGQINPPPPDPHEMVTREPRTLSKTTDRSGALDLLGRARQNFNLDELSTPYALKVSFDSSGATQNEGSGTMEWLSDGASHWRWTAQLQNSQVIRVGADDRVYGTNPSEPVPLRIQLVRSVLLRPIVQAPQKFEIRSANVVRDGKTETCLLLSHSLPPNPAPRAWVEREDCIDPATALLQTWSEAPGIYAIYDYTGAADFHGHLFPRQISIFEGGRLAVKVHVESLEDAPNIDVDLFKPSSEMVAAGESFTLATPSRLPMRVDPSDAPTSRFFQPVIVHATLDAQDGSVLDAEALQTSDAGLGRTAVDLVKSTLFEPSGFQQEVFISVDFHMPAVRLGGVPIYHSSVRWVVSDHRTRVPPVRNLKGL